MNEKEKGEGEGSEEKGSEEKSGTKQEEKQSADAFGVTLSKDGNEIGQEKVIEDTKTEQEKKENEKNQSVDIDNSPTIVALKTKIEEYGKNLTGQRSTYENKINELENKLKEAISGNGKKDEEGNNTLFTDIKYSKDLPEEVREDMTDTEIDLYDANARQQEAMNKMFDTINSNKDTQDKAKIEDLNSSAQVEATRLAIEEIAKNPELAKDSTELKDKIIIEFNEFNNEGITPDKLIVRMRKALNNVGSYTAPKEQEKKVNSGHNAVKENSKSDTDPFGVDEIVAGISKGNEGSYNL